MDIILKYLIELSLNPLNANLTKWSNTLKKFVNELCGVFDHIVGLALNGLIFF